VFSKLLWSLGIDSKKLIPPAYALADRAHICRCLRRPGIDSEEIIRKFQHSAGIFKQYMGTRNTVGIGLLYRPARASICKPFTEHGIDSKPGGLVQQPYLLYQLTRLHRLAESIPPNQFLGSLNVYKHRLRLHWLAELVPWNPFVDSITWRTKRKMMFVDRSEEKQIFLYLNYWRNKENKLFVPILSKERRQTKVFVPQLLKEQRRGEVFVPELSKERHLCNSCTLPTVLLIV
jgi:hypothetical protein